MSYDDRVTFKDILAWVVGILLGIALLLGVIMGAMWGFKAFGRSQALAEENNTAEVARIQAANEKEVNSLRIAAQEQKVLITKQDALIREEQAKGIKAAQDTISQTLTPLYVQMQMIEALEKISISGRNNTVIYIPVGPDGLPVVRTEK